MPWQEHLVKWYFSIRKIVATHFFLLGYRSEYHSFWFFGRSTPKSARCFKCRSIRCREWAAIVSWIELVDMSGVLELWIEASASKKAFSIEIQYKNPAWRDWRCILLQLEKITVIVPDLLMAELLCCSLSCISYWTS